MNILVISHYAGTPDYGMEFRPYWFAAEWVKRGHTVTVVGASFSHMRREQPWIQGAMKVEYRDNIRFVWLKTPAYVTSGIRRVTNMISFTKQLYSLNEEMMGLVPDIIIASSPHPFVIFPAQYLKKRFGSNLVFEVLDLWPLTMTELGGISKWHPFIMAMQFAEDYACRSADKVVSALPMADRYLCKRGMYQEKFYFVPNGIPIDSKESELRQLPREYVLFFERQKNKFIIAYAGKFSKINALDILLDAAKMIGSSRVHFILIGTGVKELAIKKQIAGDKLKNVTIMPPVSRNLIPSILARVDATYIGWKRSVLYQYGINPNKLLDYMLAGKPVIHSVEAANDLVVKSGCGISVPPEDSSAVAEAVIKLMKVSPDERKRIGLRGRSHVMAHYDYQLLAERFLNVLAAPFPLEQR